MKNETIRRLADAVAEKAARETIDHLCIGLGYTAVRVSSGGTGLSYTMFDHKRSCTMMPGGIDLEGRPATELLARLHSAHPVEKSAALALVNALNHDHARTLPDDPQGDAMWEVLKIGPGRRVAMVGAFPPLLRRLQADDAETAVVDDFKGIGAGENFVARLSGWAQSCIVTATAILNDTLDDILAAIPMDVPTVILGPSTPMVAAAFTGTPVRMLAGTVPVDHEAVLRAVRQGAGTPVLHRFGRKVYQAVLTL